MAVLFLGDFLVTLGTVSRAQVDAALARQEQTRLPLGQRAVRAGLMSEAHVGQVRACQDEDDRLFGEIAITLGYLTPGALAQLRAEQEADHIRLGEALVEAGAVARDQLQDLLGSYAEYRDQVDRNVSMMLSQAPHPAMVNALIRSTKIMFPRFGVRDCVVTDVRMAPHATRGIEWTAFMGLQGDHKVAVGVGVTDPVVRAIAGKANLGRLSPTAACNALSAFLGIVANQARKELGNAELSLGRTEASAGDGFKWLVELIALREFTQVTLQLVLPDQPPSSAMLTVATIR